MTSLIECTLVSWPGAAREMTNQYLSKADDYFLEQQTIYFNDSVVFFALSKNKIKRISLKLFAPSEWIYFKTTKFSIQKVGIKIELYVRKQAWGIFVKTMF